MFTQESRKFHLDCAASSNDSVSLNSSQYDHYGIIEGTCSLLDILSGSTSDDDGHGLGAGALSEHIVALISELNLFEFSADTENSLSTFFIETVNSSLQDGASGLAHTLEIIFSNTAGAENVSVSEILSGKITDWKLGENNSSARCMNLVKFIINDLPFSINDSLEVIRVLKSDLSAIFLGLKLKFEVKAEDLGVVIEALGLLFETSIRESFLKADTLDKEGVSDGASSDLLDTDILFVKSVLVDGLDGIDNHSAEESLLFGDNLRVEGSLGALLEQFSLLFSSLVSNLYRYFLDALKAHLESHSVSLDDNLRVHAFLDQALGLTKEFSSGKHDRSGAIANLVVLTLSDIDESLGCGVHNIE